MRQTDQDGTANEAGLLSLEELKAQNKGIEFYSFKASVSRRRRCTYTFLAKVTSLTSKHHNKKRFAQFNCAPRCAIDAASGHAPFTSPKREKYKTSFLTLSSSVFYIVQLYKFTLTLESSVRFSRNVRNVCRLLGIQTLSRWPFRHYNHEILKSKDLFQKRSTEHSKAQVGFFLGVST